MGDTGVDLPGLDTKLYYSIREVAGYTGVKAHVLRYWEQEFPTLRPKKNRAGNRSYRPRDIQEIRPMGFQYLTRGISPGHGAQSVQAVQVPVHIAGMDVAPGEIIHMDENGAVKFPADKLEAVLRNARALFDKEEASIGRGFAIGS